MDDAVLAKGFAALGKLGKPDLVDGVKGIGCEEPRFPVKGINPESGFLSGTPSGFAFPCNAFRKPAKRLCRFPSSPSS